MILTCPRCASRYLADPAEVWTTGRTVQCGSCGQRWRAVGQGSRPPTGTPPPEAASAPTVDTVTEESASDAGEVMAAGAERRPEPEPAQPAAGSRPDWHAAPPPEPPSAAERRLTGETLFAANPWRPGSRRGGAPALGAWLAVVFLVVIAAATLVLFRDVILAAFPGLAPAYAALGLLAHPAAAAGHG